MPGCEPGASYMLDKDSTAPPYHLTIEDSVFTCNPFPGQIHFQSISGNNAVYSVNIILPKHEYISQKGTFPDIHHCWPLYCRMKGFLQRLSWGSMSLRLKGVHTALTGSRLGPAELLLPSGAEACFTAGTD